MTITDNTIDSLLHPAEKYIIDSIFRGQSASAIQLLNSAELAELQPFIRKNGLAPLLFSKLQELDSPIANTFKIDYLSSLVRNEKILSVANKTTQILNDAGIKVLLLKGVYLSRFVYNDSALRPMSDIDILIEDQYAAKAFEILLATDGFTAHSNDKSDPTDHHLEPVFCQNVMIELHRSLLPTNAKYTIPNADIWSSAVKGVENHWAMNPNQLIIYLSLHIYYTSKRGGLRLSWFYDLYLIAHSDSLNINKTEIDHWITAWGVEKPFNQIMATLCWLSKNNLPERLKTLQHKGHIVDIKRSIVYFRESNQQQNAHSYALAWERLIQTKGLRNKTRVIVRHIKHNPINPHANTTLTGTLKRIAIIAGRSISMAINQLMQLLRMK